MGEYKITESSMDFIANLYDTYYIEDSEIYKNIGDNIKTVEFIRRKGSNLLFVEAKSSFANPSNSSNPPELLDDEISDICEKFIHSLSLLSAVKVGIVSEILPLYLNYTGNVLLKFVLVIRNHQIEWCKPVQLAIEQTLPVHIKKIWKPEILVINHEDAQKYNIVE